MAPKIRTAPKIKNATKIKIVLKTKSASHTKFAPNTTPNTFYLEIMDYFGLVCPKNLFNCFYRVGEKINTRFTAVLYALVHQC